MNLWQISWKNVWYRKVLSLLTIFSVGVATSLVVFISLSQEGMQSGAANGYAPYELVIGAEGSEIQLALNTFYHVGSPTGNIHYDIFEKLQESEQVEHAYAITKGDNYKGFQLVGTDPEYFSTRYPNIEPKEGVFYADDGEVILGSQVAKQLGLKISDQFQGSHGAVETGDNDHHDFAYKVVGIMPTLNTPDDKAIFTTLDYAWIVHQTEEEGSLSAEGVGHATEVDRHGTEDASHAHPEKGDITAIVVQPKGLVELQMLKKEFDDISGVNAAYSSKAVADVLNIVDVGAKVLVIVAGASILIAAVSILLSLSAAAAERRKDIGLLRLLGKRKSMIMSGVVLEGVILTFLGSIFGLLLGHSGSWVLSGMIFQYAGVHIDAWTLVGTELYIIAGALMIGMVSSIWPALRSYKVQPLELFH
jgi:putative ABC transport system permease protein